MSIPFGTIDPLRLLTRSELSQLRPSRSGAGIDERLRVFSSSQGIELVARSALLSASDARQLVLFLERAIADQVRRDHRPGEGLSEVPDDAKVILDAAIDALHAKEGT